MHLPSPRDQLADCVWLPRILSKARLLKAGKLEPDYAARFGHASGVDGQFLAFFRLTKEDILAVCELGSLAITEWFLQRLPVQPNATSPTHPTPATPPTLATVPDPAKPPTAHSPSNPPAAQETETYFAYASANHQIDAWNHIAVNLGREGFPMAERLPIALSTTYKHLQGQPFATVFEVLEADEYPR